MASRLKTNSPAAEIDISVPQPPVLAIGEEVRKEREGEVEYLHIPEVCREDVDEIDFLEDSCDHFDDILLAQHKTSTEKKLPAPIYFRELMQ